jgi:molybdopterin/thiamine biosynthesis adenylyltransferase
MRDINVDNIIERATATLRRRAVRVSLPAQERAIAQNSNPEPQQAPESQFDINEMISSVENHLRGGSETATQEETISPMENIQELVEQHIHTDITESVNDVQLPEEQEKQYDSVIARDETARFSSADWFLQAQSHSITLAGLGGIGSWAALLLARLKPANIYLYDDDYVEMVNLAGQLYGMKEIGKSKVDAVGKYIRDNANFYSFIARRERYTDRTFSTPVMICGFDNMSARKNFFQSWKRRYDSSPEHALFIDGRLTATEFQVFCMTKADTELMTRYEQEFLFDDSEASHEICSFKQTAYLANMIAGVIVNLYINFCANECGSPFKKALPFITKYNTDMMMFNIEY